MVEIVNRACFWQFFCHKIITAFTNLSSYKKERVIEEPKMSEIRILNLSHKKSILVDI